MRILSKPFSVRKFSSEYKLPPDRSWQDMPPYVIIPFAVGCYFLSQSQKSQTSAIRKKLEKASKVEIYVSEQSASPVSGSGTGSQQHESPTISHHDSLPAQELRKIKEILDSNKPETIKIKEISKMSTRIEIVYGMKQLRDKISNYGPYEHLAFEQLERRFEIDYETFYKDHIEQSNRSRVSSAAIVGGCDA